MSRVSEQNIGTASHEAAGSVAPKVSASTAAQMRLVLMLSQASAACSHDTSEHTVVLPIVLARFEVKSAFLKLCSNLSILLHGT